MEVSIQDICQFATKKVREQKSEDMRREHGDNTIVLFKVGDYYEAYGAAAQQLSYQLGISLSKIGNIDYALFPIRCEAIYFARLVKEGFKIAIPE